MKEWLQRIYWNLCPKPLPPWGPLAKPELDGRRSHVYLHWHDHEIWDGYLRTCYGRWREEQSVCGNQKRLTSMVQTPRSAMALQEGANKVNYTQAKLLLPERQVQEFCTSKSKQTPATSYPLLPNCNSATVTDGNVNIWCEGYLIFNPKGVVTHRLTTTALEGQMIQCCMEPLRQQLDTQATHTTHRGQALCWLHLCTFGCSLLFYKSQAL